MADPAIITRRSALVGALSSIFIPSTAIALIQPAIAGQAPMTASERADFHFAEFCNAMDEVKPADASGWRVSGGRDQGGDGWHRRDAVYRIPEPGMPLSIERFKFLSGDSAANLCFLKPLT